MLRDARYAAGISQRDVADRLGKPPSYAHKVETADRELNVIELLDYCEALGIDGHALVRKLHKAVSKLRDAEGKQS